MRTSTCIGLIALISAVACATPVQRDTKASDGTDPNADDGSGDGTDPNGDGTDPGTSDPGDPAKPPADAAKGIAISKLAFFQGVEVDVVKDGKWTTSRNAPLVANRPAMLRVYVTPDPGFGSKSITAELRLASAAKKYPILSASITVSKASTDTDGKSTINLDIPAESLPKDATFVVTLTSADGGDSGTSPARFPNDGTPKALGLQTSGKLRVVVVPVKYMADGSGRVPDITATQLALYKDTMMARYPAAEVEVTARAAWNYTSVISGGGSGFSQVLNAVTQLRKTDGVTGDVYYYGALAPASSFNSFCGGGCVTGLSTVVDDPEVSQLRASVGIGFSGADSANTMAHEVGHAHGRNHAPCGGAQGVDPDFPYSGGGIGVYGYNIVSKTLISPSTGHDMMGYCENEWVSDYTYSALFDRVSAIAGLYAGSAAPVSTSTKTFRTASVDENGVMTWMSDYSSDKDPTGGQSRDVTFVAANGTKLATQTARFYAYDHLPGGVVVMPASPASSAITKMQTDAWSHVEVQGIASRLAR